MSIYAGAEEATPNRGGYSDCQDTFVWRKITFLWKNSKIRGGFSPLAPPFPPPMHLRMGYSFMKILFYIVTTLGNKEFFVDLLSLLCDTSIAKEYTS